MSHDLQRKSDNMGDEKEIFFWLLLDDYVYWSAGTSLTIFTDVFLCHPFWRNAGTKNFESHCGIFLHSSIEVLKGNYIIFVKIKFLFRHLDQVPDPLVSLFLEPGAEEIVFLQPKKIKCQFWTLKDLIAVHQVTRIKSNVIDHLIHWNYGNS